jgi:hypothetical protein
LLKIAVLMIPQEKKQTGLVAYDAFEHPAAAARHETSSHAHKLSDRRIFLSDSEVSDFSHLAPVLVTERDMVQEILNSADP